MHNLTETFNKTYGKIKNKDNSEEVLLPPHPILIQIWSSFNKLIAALWLIASKSMWRFHIGSVLVVIGLLTSTIPTIASMPDVDPETGNRAALYGLLSIGLMLLKLQIFGLFLLGFSAAWRWLLSNDKDLSKFGIIFSNLLNFSCLYMSVSICWIGFNAVVDIQRQIERDWNVRPLFKDHPDFLSKIMLKSAPILLENSILIVLGIFIVGISLIFFGQTRSNKEIKVRMVERARSVKQQDRSSPLTQRNSGLRNKEIRVIKKNRSTHRSPSRDVNR